MCECQLFQLNIWCSRWLLFVAGERDATNVWLAQYLCTVFISTVFFSINFSIRNKPFSSLSCSFSRNLALSFSFHFFCFCCCCSSFWWEIRESYSNFFSNIFFFHFCFQKRAILVSLSFVHILIPPTVGYTQNRMMRKAQVKRCTIVFILFICCRRFCVCCVCVCIFFTCFWLFLSYLILL